MIHGHTKTEFLAILCHHIYCSKNYIFLLLVTVVVWQFYADSGIWARDRQQEAKCEGNIRVDAYYIYLQTY